MTTQPRREIGRTQAAAALGQTDDEPATAPTGPTAMPVVVDRLEARRSAPFARGC